MSRLIDRDALKTVLCASKCGVIDHTRCECGCMDVLCIDNAPTVDEPEKRNEPISPYLDFDGHDVWRCGNCHTNIFRIYETTDIECEKSCFKYCHKCGQAVKWE